MSRRAAPIMVPMLNARRIFPIEYVNSTCFIDCLCLLIQNTTKYTYTRIIFG